MKLAVNVMNLKQVVSIVEITKDMIEDERVPQEIREEYKHRLESIEWESAEENEANQTE